MTKNSIDPRLGRLIEFDKRSLAYPVAPLLEATRVPRSFTWECSTVLDQGQEGACVGFAWAHELLARPDKVTNITNLAAQGIYRTAQKLDPWPGENYEGTSVLAGAKAMQELFPTHLKSYRWAMSLEDVILTLGYIGPIVLGIEWKAGMYATDAEGYVQVKGPVVGGHAILARGVNIAKQYITLHNSWGTEWGSNGHGFLKFADLKKLLKAQGEACVPIRK